MVLERKDDGVDYVKEVRELLRTEGADAREQWNLFTEKYTVGIKSPRRIPEKKLRSFLDHYRLGYRIQSMAASLRTLLKHSPALQEAWQEVVRSESNDPKDMDPNAYSEQFVEKFLESLVVDDSNIPPRVMLARKVRLLIEEGIGGFEDEWADYVKGLQGSQSLEPQEHSTEALEKFISDSDPDLLDAEKGDLIYAVEQFLRVDQKGAELWTTMMGKSGGAPDDDFPDPRDCDAELLERFMESVRSRIHARAAQRSQRGRERLQFGLS